MPRVSDIELLDTAEQPALCVRARVKAAALPRAIGEGYGKLGAYLRSLDVALADVPFVKYNNADMNDLDVQMGFPVALELPENGDIAYCPIPAGKRVFCMYRGPYAGIAPVYAEMAAWMEQNGYEPEGTAYEYYYNGPDGPQDDLLTRIVMPVR